MCCAFDQPFIEDIQENWTKFDFPLAELEQCGNITVSSHNEQFRSKSVSGFISTEGIIIEPEYVGGVNSIEGKLICESKHLF